MAGLSSAAPRFLDGGGPRLLSGYSPPAPSTAGLPPGPDPYLLAKYERYQQEGGHADFDSFVRSSFLKNVDIQDFVMPRQRRMAGSERAAADKLKQQKLLKQKRQGLKMAATSTAEFGFQGDASEQDKLDWANVDLHSVVLPSHTGRFESLVCPPKQKDGTASVWVRAGAHNWEDSVNGVEAIERIRKAFNLIFGVPESGHDANAEPDDGPGGGDGRGHDGSGGHSDTVTRGHLATISQWTGFFTDDLTRELMIFVGSMVAGLFFLKVIAPVVRLLKAMMRKIRALCRPLLPFHKEDDEDEGPGDPSPPTEEPQGTSPSPKPEQNMPSPSGLQPTDKVYPGVPSPDTSKGSSSSDGEDDLRGPNAAGQKPEARSQNDVLRPLDPDYRGSNLRISAPEFRAGHRAHLRDAAGMSKATTRGDLSRGGVTFGPRSSVLSPVLTPTSRPLRDRDSNFRTSQRLRSSSSLPNTTSTPRAIVQPLLGFGVPQGVNTRSHRRQASQASLPRPQIAEGGEGGLEEDLDLGDDSADADVSEPTKTQSG